MNRILNLIQTLFFAYTSFPGLTNQEIAMIFSRFLFAIICAGGLFLSTTTVSAQSTVIEFGPGSSAVPVPARVDFPNTSLNSQQKAIEHLLSQRFPRRFDQTSTLGELIDQCRQLGLPITIDRSALEDEWEPNKSAGRIEDSLPLYDMLENTLNRSNATLALYNQHLTVISLDDVDQQYCLTQITYDVSSLVNDRESFREMIVETIDPENWSDVAGNAEIRIHVANGRTLMIVSQSYKNHRQIRELLQGLARVQGSGQLARTNSQSAFTESRVIQLPIIVNRGPRILSGRVRGGGSGIGGYGGGGGVF